MNERGWRFIRIMSLGLVLTAAVALLDWFGGLLALEQWTYDLRVRYCQHWFAPADSGLVQVMIDDQSIGVIGRWPWPRTAIADLVDTAVRDGAAQLAFDITFSDPENRPTPEQSVGPGDARLAQSLRDARAAGVGVLLPVEIDFDDSPRHEPLRAQCVRLLTANLEATPDDLAAALGVSVDTLQRWYYGPALTQAIADTARRVVGDAKRSDAEALSDAFPNLTRQHARNNQTERFREALAEARVTERVEHHFQAAGNTDALKRCTMAAVPFDALADAATHFAYVNYLPVADGKVRTVPLLVHAQGRLVPQFGLAIAAMRLGLDVRDPRQLEVGPSALVLRPPGRPPVTVPVRSDNGDPTRPVGALMDIPLRGNEDWQTLYAPRTDAFMPVLELRRVHDTEQALVRNLATIEKDAHAVLDMFPPPDDDASATRPSAAAFDAVDATLALGSQALAAVRAVHLPDCSPEATARLTAAQQAALKPRERDLRETIVRIDRALPLTRQLRDQAVDLHGRLRDKIAGKLLIFGWASSSAAADHVPTSLHAECPGCVIHGAIANAILSGELWTHLPRSDASVLTFACGILVTLCVASMTPWKAFVATGVLGLGVTIVASVCLFDYGNRVVGLAGPVSACVVCWAAGTLVVTIRERIDRALVTQRFRNYVDPALVAYVLEHPERPTLSGEMRELTVVFVDIEGFTSLTEQMGERSIAILRQFMDAMVPIIRKHGGYVNKFLGDGIMFFFGAPQYDPDHACHAIATVLEMQQALEQINARLTENALPKIGLRAGISTGDMLVGDAGSADASDYTVLGDAVNLGARLESANKSLGTSILATARTMELCGDAFFYLPLGRLQVVGKKNAVAVCEPLCVKATATAAQVECAELLQTIWAHIRNANGTAALAHLSRLRASGERPKVCELLQRLLEQTAATPIGDASMRLTEK